MVNDKRIRAQAVHRTLNLIGSPAAAVFRVPCGQTVLNQLCMINPLVCVISESSEAESRHETKWRAPKENLF